MKSRYQSLQILRGIAALFVAFHHYVQLVFQSKATGWLSGFFLSKGHFGVDVFFVLSGFIMALTAQKYEGRGGKFIANRLIRILPNYWFYTILLTISVFLLPAICYITDWNIRSLILSMLLFPNKNPNGAGYYPFLYVGWTLLYELFFYGILGAAILFFKRNYLYVTILAMLVIIGALHGHRPFGNSNGWFLNFIAGMCIQIIWSKTEQFSLTLKTLAMIAVAVFGLFGLRSEWMLHLFTASWIVLGMLIIDEIIPDGRLVKLLIVMGDISYSVYLSHVVVLGWVIGIVGIPKEVGGHILAISIYLFTIIIVSKFTFRHIETGSIPKQMQDTLTRFLTPNQHINPH